MFSVRQALDSDIVSLLAFSTFRFLPLTNVSILMLNFTERRAADDYLNKILSKCALVKCVTLIT